MVIACFGFAKADVEINATNFPNLNFRVWIVHNVDIVNDGVLTDMEIANITEIDTYTMNFNNISDITGIEFLTDLERLNITNTTESQRVCSITNVDLSQNKKLKHFTFSRASSAAPALLSLNISNLPELETTSITQAGITELDCSGCSKLKSLSIPNGELTSITLDGCTSLETLDCRENKIKTLNVDGCNELTTLLFDSNPLSELRVANCAKLSKLNCENKNIISLTLENLPTMTSLNCSKNKFQELRVENMPSLKELICSHNENLKTLDCSNLTSLIGIDFSYCKKLETFPELPSNIQSIDCSCSPILAEADLSLYPELFALYAEYCELKDFDASKCRNLKILNLENNNIPALDISELQNLSANVKIKQWIDYPAKRVIKNNKYVWEITMPENFNPTRLMQVTGNTFPYTGKTTEVSYTTFIDAYDNERVKFFSSDVSYALTSGVGAFYYVYQTMQNSKKYMSTVQVFCYNQTSDVEDVSTSKIVSGVRYYDLQGHESAEPFNGFNIEVTHYTDGTTQSKKFIR